MPLRQDDLESRFGCDLVRGCHLIAGFSGGADSVSLVHFLWSCRQQLDCTLEAVHLNHCLRGSESDRDEDFVRAFCAERDIPLTVRRTDIAALAGAKGISEETCGREARYALFEEAAAAYTGTKEVRIVTAHTLSDDLETALFRLARGTGPDGFCGIPERRGNIVRPLIRCTRAMVEAYCNREKLDYITDSTNSDTAYARNRIRAEAVPALKAVNSAAEEHYLRLREILQSENSYLDGQTDRLMEKARRADGYDTAVLRGEHPALLNRAALKMLRERELPADQNNVSVLAGLITAGQGSAEIRPGASFTVRRGILRFEEDIRAEVTAVTLPKDLLSDGFVHRVTIPYTLALGEVTRRQEKTVWLRVISAKDWSGLQKVYENLLFFAADYDTIIGGLIFRSRQAGDRLAQPSRGERTLKKLYSEAGMTALERQTGLVAADDRSVIWAEGFETDRRAAVRKDTGRVLLALRSLPEND